jgi:hypothetical protein
MECPMCKNRGKTWNGDNPKCAFRNGVFNTDNWNCATMNALRNIAERNEMSWRFDLTVGSFGLVPYEGDETKGIIFMTWYKNRGQTGNAIIMCDDELERPLTLREAEEAINEYTKEANDA